MISMTSPPTDVEALIRAMPKVELHVHIEGTLEPELMFQIAERNRIALPYASLEHLRTAYSFSDLQSFLDIYYAGAEVLRSRTDFYDLALSYFKRVRRDHVRHAEIFFDPQTHTARGIPFATVIDGLHRAQLDAAESFGISSRLIMCFLRHLSAEAAMETLEQALPFRQHIDGVGLDSSERDHPPEKFVEVFARAGEQGFTRVAHAGEEGPPEFIRQALDLLGVSRIDHGVRCLEDPALVRRLREEAIPLTVCPLSNVALRVFETMEQHNLRDLLEAGLCVTLNSDDPAYFGGYITDNFLAAQRALGLDRADILTLGRNAIEASLLDADARQTLHAELGKLAGTA